MRTLDKMWEHHKQDGADEPMEDKEQKTETNSMNGGVRNANSTANTDNGICDNNSMNKSNQTSCFSVRFKITADTIAQAHTQHKNVIEAICKEMTFCEIRTKQNEGKPINEITQTMFDYHAIGRKTKQFIVVHDMTTNVEYPQLKRNPTIFEALKQNQCYLQKHMWTNDVWNIVTIGYLSGASPKHEAKDTFKNRLDDNITNGLAYEIGAATIKIRSNGEEYNTFAYEVKGY